MDFSFRCCINYASFKSTAFISRHASPACEPCWHAVCLYGAIKPRLPGCDCQNAILYRKNQRLCSFGGVQSPLTELVGTLNLLPNLTLSKIATPYEQLSHLYRV